MMLDPKMGDTRKDVYKPVSNSQIGIKTLNR